MVISTGVRFVRRQLRPLKRALRRFVGPESLHDRPEDVRTSVCIALERLMTRIERPSQLLRDLSDPPPFTTVVVYRQRNEGLVRRLLSGASGNSALWLLGERSEQTTLPVVGAGDGTRFENINRALRLGPPLAPDWWLVIADDDVTFERGDLNASVALAALAELDISQPSHATRSHLNWDVCRHRPRSNARLTRFVDQGPVIILSPRARKRLVPLPEELGMGWGVEAVWATYADLRIGVLDAVTIVHESPVTRGGYDIDAEWAQAMTLLHLHGKNDWSELQKELARWRVGEPRPQWVGNGDRDE